MTPDPKQRVRSEAQLDRKRIADRKKHRENRHETKNRLERIEADVAAIKRSLEGLTLQLQAPAHGLPLAAAPICQDVCDPSLVPALEAPQATPQLSPPWQLGYSHPAPISGMAPPPGVLSHTTLGYWRYPTGQTSPRTMDCRCGTQHPDRFDCMDHCTVTIDYQRVITYPQHPGEVASPQPRNPSLASMILQSLDENILTFFITGFLRQCKIKSMEQLLGFYFLGYRCMRWRLNPNHATLKDVPEWMLPTDIQNANAHPVCVDYLPWPRLRDYMCSSGDVDPRHSIQFYIESITFNWPGDGSLFIQDSTGAISLSPEFEVHAGDLRNWTMGPPWSEAFPHLMHLVHA